MKRINFMYFIYYDDLRTRKLKKWLQMRAQRLAIDEQFQNDREASDKKIVEFIVAERTTALAINNKKVSGWTTTYASEISRKQRSYLWSSPWARTNSKKQKLRRSEIKRWSCSTKRKWNKSCSAKRKWNKWAQGWLCSWHMDFGSVPSLVPFLFSGFSSGAVEVQHKNGHFIWGGGGKCCHFF